MAEEEPYKPPGAPKLEAYIRQHFGSIPKFCEAKGIDRIKVQRAIGGGLQRVDVDFAFDIEHATGGWVVAEDWCTPDVVREERRKRRADRSTRFEPGANADADENPPSEKRGPRENGDSGAAA
jgi:hypothetical protein